MDRIRVGVGLASLLASLACASPSPPEPQTLLDRHPAYGELQALSSRTHSARGLAVAVQGCEELHRSFASRGQAYVDCSIAGDRLEIVVAGLPDAKRDPGRASELASMLAMVESSWCLAHKLVLGHPEAAVAIVYPDGRRSEQSCAHFLER